MIDPIHVEVLLEVGIDLILGFGIFLVLKKFTSKPVNVFKEVYDRKPESVSKQDLEKLLDFELDVASKVILWRLGFVISISIFSLQVLTIGKNIFTPIYQSMLNNLLLILWFFLIFDYLHFLRTRIGVKIMLNYLDIRDKIKTGNRKD